MDTVQLALNGMPESECGSGHQFDPTTFMFKHSLSGGLDTCGTVVDYGSNGELIFRAVSKIKLKIKCNTLSKTDKVTQSK